MYLFQRVVHFDICNAGINLHSTMYLFQHACCQAYFFRGVNLHSTMYLFQQAKDADTIISDLVIYIPLCIYFNYNVLN